MRGPLRPSLVIGSPCICSVCYGGQRGRDIAPSIHRDADPFALESSLHWLRHCSRNSRLAASERHDTNDTRRARRTPDRVSQYRDGNGIGESNNAVAYCAERSLDWLCRDFGGGPTVCNRPAGFFPGLCVQFWRCADWGRAGVDLARLLGKDQTLHARDR